MCLTRLALSSTLAIMFALAAVATAQGQGPDVQIAELQCTGDPEVVRIENRGDSAQQLAGWELQSDPVESEVFDLRVVGGIIPAASSASIQSGPSASGVFIWSSEFIFRDDDPTDYARIVDDTGTVVHQVSCAAAATPTPSPEPTPPADVPNGGGPPPISGGALSPAMIVLIGGSMAAAGLATITLPRLRLRHAALPAAPPHGERVGRDHSRGQPPFATFALAMIGLAVVVVLLLRHRGD